MIRRLILGQHIVPYIGAVKSLLMNVMFYISIMNFLMISLVSYQTSVKPWAIVHASWLNLWVFICILIVIVIIATIIEYKFVIPSIYSFANMQSATHNSPIYKDTQEIIKLLKEKKDAN